MDETFTVGKSGVSRRRFIGYVWATSLLAILGEATVGFLGFFWPRIKAGAFGSKFTLGKVEEYPVGSVTSFPTGRFSLVRTEPGFLALYQRCTHLGCITKPWDEEQQVFHCTCHGSLFTREGEVISGPAPRPLDLFPVEIIEGMVVVDTDPRSAESRDHFDPSQAVKV
jgi:cytochrome b6-f complex iron-sulfur subunit